MFSRLKTMFNFYCTGFDSGFSLRQMNLVWRLAREASVSEPTVLFWSIPLINKAIARIVTIETDSQTINSKETQDFLNRLYLYRSKIELDPPLKKGLKSTSLVRIGQRLRLVLPSYGIFTSVVLNNEGLLTISYPTPVKSQYRCFDWSQKKVTVYFWRKNDAGYIFDTDVKGVGHYRAQSVLYLNHTTNLQRSQKRKSIRCPCSIMAQLYLLNSTSAKALIAKETVPGIKCVLEDLSEDGALIRIGGKGQESMAIKIQFMLGETCIVMSGDVKSVEYNEKLNQSRLHFMCLNIDEVAKQTVSLYVYSIIPQEQKEAFDAIKLIEEDEENDDLSEEELFELESVD